MIKINCILLVDDNPADNEFHAITIRRADVCKHIKIVTSGQKGLDYLIKAGEDGQAEEFPRPDLIFLDINMPGMNGFEFLEEYRKLDPRLKSRAVLVMLTNSLNPEDEKRTLENPDVTGFLNKPLTKESLIETIEKNFSKDVTR